MLGRSMHIEELSHNLCLAREVGTYTEFFMDGQRHPKFEARSGPVRYLIVFEWFGGFVCMWGSWGSDPSPQEVTSQLRDGALRAPSVAWLCLGGCVVLLPSGGS